MWINVQKLLMILGLMSLVAISCVPNQKAGGSRRTSRNASAGGSTDTGPTPNPPAFDNPSEVFWYSGESSFENIITVNEDIATVVYLRGNSINEFLAASLDGSTLNENLTYCLVASYNTSGAEKNFRARAVPISFFNFTTSTKERLLRIDLPDTTSSSSTCGGSAYNIQTTVDAASTVGNTDSAFSLPSLCSNCTGIISSTDVSLYIANSTTITTNDRIPESSLNLNDLVLRVDTQSGSNTQTGSCTDSACAAKGFDCCLDGQCVNDGNLRPNASSQQDFTQALADVANNPNNFINWPSIYFVCGSTPADPIPTPTPFPDAESTAAARLAELIKDFNCLEEGKNAFPDFGGNNVCEPSFDQTSYEAVRAKVWAYCGCEADPFPTDPEDPRCPDFGLEATRDINDNIIDITCFTPQPPAQPTPFQSLSLSVNTRSSPHRFFRADTGASVDDITTLESTVLPEGTPFQYTDDSSKTGPDCSGDATGASTAECQYNLNSIFGQFNVTLDQSRPATVVNLDFDQAYIISTISGFYTPCPTCVTDYWFQSFTAYPDSQQGVGLEALGYQTNRQTFGNNNPRGNFEDTRFGRACFLPPTMIPLSHKPNANVHSQRQNRLLTQTAMWINGYQRDWFGFNKGALIGSFDGVKWFGIGKNRRVTSDTGKLFLAINAPFADLTDPSDLIVQIVLDQGNSVAPLNDYDPNFEPDAPEQNSAASCQYYHQCNTDTDCITKLGWEYMCVDTNNFRTRWPKFDVEANELADSEYESATFSRIIQGGMPSGNRKRCMYRGAGALCKRDYTSDTLLDNRKKQFACAPDFHCASLDASEFNNRVARTPNKLTNIIFGFEADILGRPLNYANATETLPDQVKENIRYNGELYTTETSDLGLCRPGRQSTNSNAIRQHEDKDSGGRMDFIGQVGTCNSSETGDRRVQACPLIQTEDDQLTEKGDLILATDPIVGSTNTTDINNRNALLTKQNACGYESEITSTSPPSNTFASVEASPIRFINSLVTPSIAQDACIRRAGSVCHTDLDCGPNRLHESIAFSLSRNEFGGTEAELNYWQESLICGQAAEEPLPGADDYFDYDMSKNRCCREVGKDFTMYTKKILNTGVDTNNELLDVLAFPHDNPAADGRYSRYVAAGAEDDASKTALDAPYAQAPIVDIAGGKIPKAYQWKTLNDTGTNNCCGGGWIRKFADGSTNWNDPSRLRLNPLNFQCLNYHREDADFNDVINYFTYADNLARDIDRYCLSPLENGCSQIEFPAPTSDGSIVVPLRKSSPSLSGTSAFSVTETLDTTPANTPSSGGAVGMSALNFNVPFEPLPYANPVALDDDASDGIDRFTYFFNQADYFGVSFYVPSYMGYIAGTNVGASNNITSVTFSYFREDGTLLGTSNPLNCSSNAAGTAAFDDCNGDTFVTAADICNMDENPERDLEDNQFCFVETADGLVFHARANTALNDDNGTPGDTSDDIPWAYASIQMNFNLQNGTNFIYGSAPYNTVDPEVNEGMFRGNELYYLTKLGRLELLGIPQIVYEPIYCNTNRSKLVDGIFTEYTTREEFDDGVGSSPPAIGMNENGNIDENGRPLIAMYDDRYTSPNSSQTADYDIGGTTTADESLFYDWNGATWTDRNEKFVFQTTADNQSLLVPPAIFSENDFRCCVKLGEAASEDAKCCSGNRDGDGLCKLPQGADLHVYFNKFVSSEGIGEDLPDGGLLETDFIPETGEPKVSSTVLSKLRSLGEAFCETGEVRGGGAFGFFFPEPNNGAYQHREAQDDIDAARKYSIIDSTRDFDPDSESGTSPFLNGFRWDHHLYCGPPAAN